MDGNELRRMLCADSDPASTGRWLRGQYFPEIVSRFNSEESRKRFGLYRGEKIPANERNLTDVRTRMGNLIKFELARISNELLLERGVRDIFWSYVAANRFPDLEIRRNSGERLLRLEIKCLQCIAEEKSANFDTLLKDINPRTDFVAVCLWDWSSAPSNTYGWDCVPVVYKTYVLHAYSLASMRDAYWLNQPPSSLGGGFQGFDIRYAVTCENGVYSKEQGNNGKLLRIWKPGFQYRPAASDALSDTEDEYLALLEEAVQAGFEILAKGQLRQLGTGPIEEIMKDGAVAGYKSGLAAYVRSSVVNYRSAAGVARENQVRVVVFMTERYRGSVYLFQNGRAKKIHDAVKPKNLVSLIKVSLP